MKVYMVTYNGTTRIDSVDIYLQGIYTSKRRAEDEAEKLEAQLLPSFVHEVELDSPLEIRDSEDDPMDSYSTDVQLACYYE